MCHVFYHVGSGELPKGLMHGKSDDTVENEFKGPKLGQGDLLEDCFCHSGKN